MKDITSTSLGLIIATLLPGLGALYSIGFWSSKVRVIFAAFVNAQSDLGLFFLVMLTALAIGLLISLPRWIVFEECLLRKYLIPSSDFKTLRVKDNLDAFRATVDEHYRYHQFFGSMTFVVPPLLVGWLKESWSSLSCTRLVLCVLSILVTESMIIWGAVDAYKKYSHKGSAILKGE